MYTQNKVAEFNFKCFNQQIAWSWCGTAAILFGTVHLEQHLHTYNWINQLSNTTIWWLDICCLLHRYQVHVSALMAIFRLTDWQQTCKQLYFGMCLVCGGGGLGLDGGTSSRVCWVGRVMWVHGYYCAVHGYYCAVHGYYCAGRPRPAQ
jgi:hypothetical protein